MVSLLKTLLRRIGVDYAIGYTVIARGIQAGGGVLSIIFIAKYLTRVEQGYYYTFGSILALQIFFELGFSGIITQYAAHEMAHLEFLNGVDLEGDQLFKSRLSSLLHFSVKWVSIMAIFLFIGLLITGNIFFSKYGHHELNKVEWVDPWIILSIATACSLTIDTVLSFIAGLGLVKEVAKVRLIQQTLQLICLLLLLKFGLKLYASPLALVVVLFVIPVWLIISNYYLLLLNIWKYKIKRWVVDYRKEILPYQWKIAISWISGYLIFQLFNPVVFASQGPVAAGRMGMSLAILNGVLSLAISWNSTKVPLYSSLIAQRKFKKLDSVFKSTFYQSTFVCFLGVATAITAITLLRYFHISISDRFLLFAPFLFLSIATMANQVINALATYLRCHKEEPLLIQSIVLGVLITASTIILGRWKGVVEITFSFSLLTLFVGLPWTIFIFKTKRKLWHEVGESKITFTINSNSDIQQGGILGS